MTPISEITLFASKLDISNKYVLYYSSGFLKGVVNSVSSSSKTFTNCYWIRENVSFRCNGNINDLKKYNYCVYANPSKESGVKQYGAFIVNFTYINDAMTEIVIATDSWLTYLPQITFNDSAMLQCHPTKNYENNILNYNAENVDVMLFPETLTPIPFADGVDDSKDRILVTGLVPIKPDINLEDLVKKTTTYRGAQNLYGSDKAETAWENITRAVELEGTEYLQWFEDNLKSYICSFQGIYQRPTTVYAKEESQLLKEILDALAITELTGLFVSAYLIPGIFAETLKDFTGGTAITTEFRRVGVGSGKSIYFHRDLSNIKWNKILYSPQFNNLSVNFFGSTNELPLRILSQYKKFALPASMGGNVKIQYDIKPLFNEKGCAILTTYLSDEEDSTSLNPISMITSPKWDHVNIEGFAPTTLSENIDVGLQSGGQILNTIKSVIKGLANINEVGISYSNKYLRGLYSGSSNESLMNLYETDSPLLQEASLNLAYRQVQREALGKKYNTYTPIPSITLPTYPTAITGIKEINEGNVWSRSSIGNSSISAYLMTAPPIVYSWCYPNNDGTQILNHYFGLYGYNFNGDIQPIEIQNDSLNWVFYRTVDCNIVGKDVPQENLLTIKSMFDNGVFIFQNANTYKDLSHAENNHY